MDEMKKKRSIGLIIFGLIFFIVGVGIFAFSAAPNIYDGWKMQSWLSTQATLTSGGLKSSYSDNTRTYKAFGKYRYSVNGFVYNNDRVSLSDGSDNIGNFQQQLGSKLSLHYKSNRPITIWYNPINPAESIVNRDIRWGMVGFKFIFLLVFGGVGLVILISAIKGKKVNTSVEDTEFPWLARPEWKNGSIKSDAKLGMYGIWGVAIFWNLISFPVAIPATIEALEKQNYVALVALLFPLIGLGLLFWAVKKTKEWKRFGITPLTMDPYPGSINGQVGGTIQVNMPYDPNLNYKVTLNCIHSYMSGSGKERSRKESVEWQDEGYAKVIPGGQNISLEFCFNVPDNLPVSEESSDNYHLWRLNLESEMEGADLNRSFEIPVYNTQQHQTDSSFNSAEYRPTGIAELSIESLIPLNKRSSIIDIYYPMFRKPALGLGLILFGAFFLVIGSFIFFLVGGAIFIGGLYSAFNSLHVKLDGSKLHYKRKFLLFTLKDVSIPYSEIRDIDGKESGSTQVGRKHKIEYNVYAYVNKDKLTLAEHIDSVSKKDFVVDYFKQKIVREEEGELKFVF